MSLVLQFKKLFLDGVNQDRWGIVGQQFLEKSNNKFAS